MILSNFYGCNGNYQFNQYTEQGNFRGNNCYFYKRCPNGLVCNIGKSFWKRRYY